MDPVPSSRDRLGYSISEKASGGLGEAVSRLRQIREAKGISQRELGRRLDLTDSAISRIESGQRRLSTQMASKWAAALRVSVAELMEIETEDATLPHQTIRVVGHISASYRPADALPTEALIPVVPWGRYRNLEHSAFYVEDDTARSTASKGSYVITVPFSVARRSALEGDIVVIAKRIENLTRHSAHRVATGKIEVGGIWVSIPPDGMAVAGLVTAIYQPLDG